MLPDIDQLLVPEVDASGSEGEQDQELARLETEITDACGEDPEHLVPVYIRLVRLLISRHDFTPALSKIEAALCLPVQPRDQLELFLAQGACHARTGAFAPAENSFLRAAEIARKLRDNLALARALFLLVSYNLVIRGKFNIALAYIEEAQTNFAIAGRNHWGAPWLKAYIHLQRGDSRHARQILYDMAREIEPAKAISAAYYFLWARLAIDEEEIEQAREYLRLGLRIAMQTEVPELRVWLHLEQARFHRTLNQLPIAREWAEEAFTQALRLSLPYFEACALLEYAKISWQGNDSRQAMLEIHQAMTIFQSLGANYDLAYAKFLLAFWSNQLAHPDAEKYWGEAAEAMLQGGFIFILEKEQEPAFRLTAAWLRSGNPQSKMFAEQLLEQLASVPPRPLRILGLGQFSVWKGRQYIPDKSWLRRRADELFRFLLIQPNRSASKDTILDTLWPDNDPKSATGLLHQATSALRRLLEPDLPDKFPSRYLFNEGEQWTLRLPTGSLVDFEVFSDNLRVAMAKKRADQIKEAISTYKGILFPMDQYADWTAELRTRLEELHQEGLVTLAGLHLEQERFADAFECVHQVLLIDPWNEDAVLIGMRTYLRLGSAPHALRLYNQIKTTLEKELQILPRKDLQQLAESIRSSSNK